MARRSGLLHSGPYAGWFVRVEPTEGGYLILIEERQDELGEGYDDWQPTFEEAVAMVESEPWDVEWTSSDRETGDGDS